MRQRLGAVARGHQFVEPLVFLAVDLGVGHHLLDLLVRKTGAGLDLDALLLAGLLVLGRDMQDAVGVDIEGDLDLRHASWLGRNAGQIEARQRLVGCRLFALALQHMHGDRALVVIGSREDLRSLGRNRGVLLDQLGKHPAQGLDAQRQRRYIKQQHVFDLALQYATLNRRADRHGLVRVDVAPGLAAEKVLHRLLHQRHAGLTADQDHFIDIADLQSGIVERGLARLDRTLDQIFDQRFQLCPCDLDAQVLRAGLVGRDVGQVDFGLLARGQLDLGPLGRLAQALQSQRILLQIDALILLELGDQVILHPVVEVLAAEEGVAIGGQHLKLLFAIDVGNLDDRHVEGAAAQVIDRDLAVRTFLVQPIGQRRGGRLVDDAAHVQARNLAGVLGRLAL